MDNANLIKNNFLPIWHHFLFFEIMRSKFAVKAWGSANGYLIFQVICWHHVLIVTSTNDTKLRDEAVLLWSKLSQTGFQTNTVLTYTLISELTFLSIETVRRQVKKLEEKNWVSYSKTGGVKYNPSEDNNKYLTDNFNLKEVDSLGNLLDIIEKKISEG